MTVTANDIPLDECVQWKVSPLNVSSESNKLEKREICHLSFRWRNVNFASKIYGSHPAREREREKLEEQSTCRYVCNWSVSKWQNEYGISFKVCTKCHPNSSIFLAVHGIPWKFA